MTKLVDLIDEGVRELVDLGAAPGVAAAVTSADETIAAAAYGVKRVGLEDVISVEDAMHIGSCTKAMTATIIAKAVDDGHLDWTSPITRWLSEPLHPDRSRVNLIDLLAHRAGIPPYDEEEHIATLPPFASQPMQQRAELATLVLNAEPVAKVGEEFIYSNAGYAIAAAVCEAATGVDWETAIADMFAGVDIKMGLGWPATLNSDGPWGHRLVDGHHVPHDPTDAYQLAGWIATAGDVHMSTAEMMKWARLNLRGLGGSSDFLRTDTWRTLHSPHGQAGLGWGIQDVMGKVCSVHSGSAGTFTTLVVLLHEPQIGIVVNANAGEESSEAGLVEFLKAIVAEVV